MEEIVFKHYGAVGLVRAQDVGTRSYTRQSRSNQTRAESVFVAATAITKSQDNGTYCHKKVLCPICSLSINQSENWCS